MPYKAEISALNPILFVFLIDQSGSMAGAFGNSRVSKAQGVADSINRLLSELVLRGTVGDRVRNYCEVAVLGYGASKGYVMPVFGGELSGKEIVSISEIAVFPARIENRVTKQPDKTGGLVDVPTRFPVWFEPISGADTPMARAFQRAEDLVSRWVKNHPNAFPPIVINITDGEATDADPTPYAERLKSIATLDGNVLLFNCFISSVVSEPILFPEKIESLQDSYSKKMFEMSSPLPPSMTQVAQQQGFRVGNDSRGFAYQADLKEVIQFLEIGTRPPTMEHLETNVIYGNYNAIFEDDTEVTSTLFGGSSVVVVDNPSVFTLHLSETQKLTPIFLSQIVSPYIVAIAGIQKVIDEIHNTYDNAVVVRSITQNSPISVSLDGASEAIKTVQENVVSWRRENAKKLAELSETEKQVNIEVLKAETLEKRANAAKNRAEAEKIIAEADKQRQEAEKLKLENEKSRIEIERAKIQLALDILDRIAPDLSSTEKIAYVVKLLPPLDVVALSSIEAQPTE